RPGERRSLIVVGLTGAMMVVEIAAGLTFGSMALLADGLHMASHAAALGIAAFAYIYARRRARDPRFSFGTGKVNALAGFAGALLLVVFAVLMGWESAKRFVHPITNAFEQATLVAAIGLVVNGACVLILGGNEQVPTERTADPGEHGHHGPHDHNLRSAYLHVLADALTSLLAIFALLSGKYFGLTWMDPLMGIVGMLLGL
ncbi:CDF family Co(II)/Ni(II) efflux transporter DmeF, partial [Nitrospirales bacterium NOB]|nr:CDF family Co(II)/Ni(II) efflux transporter DmeF [Nitrospirales bacterium NOB]